jgi:bisphosphoglycerate-dependent phosphoglycerate mutase
MSHPPRQSEKEIKIFHSEVAGYFQNRALELGKDLIIVTHQDVVYNLAKEIASNDMMKTNIGDFEINYGSVFHYSKFQKETKYTLKKWFDE